MPSQDSTSPSQRISASYKQLAASAAQLNAASDELGESISALDAALRKLNLGISTWVKIAGEEDGDGTFWARRLGYDKIGGKWGIAIHTSRGNHNYDEYASEEWLFNDSPRAFRIEAVEKLPELLEHLIKEADQTTKKIKHKVAYARELAVALTELTQPSRRGKPEAAR